MDSHSSNDPFTFAIWLSGIRPSSSVLASSLRGSLEILSIFSLVPLPWCHPPSSTGSAQHLSGTEGEDAGIVGWKEKAAEVSAVVEVDESLLPRAPSPTLISLSSSSVTLAEKSAHTTNKPTPAVSISEVTTRAESTPKIASAS